MFLSLLKLFLFNVISIGEGFLLGLLLRELYRLRFSEPPREEFVPAVYEPLDAEPVEEIAEPTPEPVQNSVAEPEIPSPELPPAEPSHRKIDEFDESLLPNGFKAENVIGNMLDAGQAMPKPEDVVDFSAAVRETDPFSGAAAAFEDEDVDSSYAMPFESEPIDFS